MILPFPAPIYHDIFQHISRCFRCQPAFVGVSYTMLPAGIVRETSTSRFPRRYHRDARLIPDSHGSPIFCSARSARDVIGHWPFPLLPGARVVPIPHFSKRRLVAVAAPALAACVEDVKRYDARRRRRGFYYHERAARHVDASGPIYSRTPGIDDYYVSARVAGISRHAGRHSPAASSMRCRSRVMIYCGERRFALPEDTSADARMANISGFYHGSQYSASRGHAIKRLPEKRSLAFVAMSFLFPFLEI